MKTQKTILIGYGSRIRGDDAAGLVLAERFAANSEPGFHAIATPQLYPELAHEISFFDQVIFVDATVASSARDSVAVHALCDHASTPVFGHAYSPERIVEMARNLYGAAPRAWIVTIPGFDFDWKEALSPASEAAIAEASHAVLNLIEPGKQTAGANR